MGGGCREGWGPSAGAARGPWLPNDWGWLPARQTSPPPCLPYRSRESQWGWAVWKFCYFLTLELPLKPKVDMKRGRSNVSTAKRWTKYGENLMSTLFPRRPAGHWRCYPSGPSWDADHRARGSRQGLLSTTYPGHMWCPAAPWSLRHGPQWLPGAGTLHVFKSRWDSRCGTEVTRVGSAWA